jgi:hypothetical protein
MSSSAGRTAKPMQPVNNKLKLNWGEKREAIGFIIGEAVGTGVGTAKGFVRGRESSKSSFGDGVRFGFSRRGAELKDFSDAPRARDGSGRGKECLKTRRNNSEGKHGSPDGGINGGAKGKVGQQTERSCNQIVVDGFGDRCAKSVAKAKRDKVVHGEESGTDGPADVCGFERNVERTVRDMGESSDEFSGAAEEGVLQKQIGEKIKAASLEIWGVLDGRAMVFTERPRTRLVKVAGDDAEADMVVAWVRGCWG